MFMRRMTASVLHTQIVLVYLHCSNFGENSLIKCAS